MDPSFVNDAVVYYNLPPVLDMKCGGRRSTLPRPHSSFICERSSSCPTTPKLSLFKPKGKAPSLPTEPSPQMDLAKNGREDLLEPEPLYQNVGPTKPRRKPIFFPWWKRKRLEPGPDGETAEGPEAASTPVIEQRRNPPSPPKNEVPSHRDSAEPPSSNYLALPTRSSSCSSSTTLNDEDDGSFPLGGEHVLGGVSYVKPSKTSSPKYPSDSSPAGSATAPEIDLPQRIALWVREWKRKSRWLNRRRREKNPRHNGEGDVDIAVVHYGKDTSLWADYLHDSFTTLLQDTLGHPLVRIERIDVEVFSRYPELPEVQAARLKDSKLQMVILCPGLLAFLSSHSEFQLGKLLRPNRVLALLLGLTQEDVKRNSVAMSAMYSFEEWSHVQVRDRDERFIAQVHERSLRLLTRCDVFDRCLAPAPFSVCPRKITQSYCKVYLHFKWPMKGLAERQVHVTVGQSASGTVPIGRVQCHNPFTLSFDMPEKLLGVSAFLKVILHVDGVFIGSREVKCEGPVEILKDLLKSAVDPTGLMCQALGICPLSDDLDQILARKVKDKIPMARNFNDESNSVRVPATHEMPTWLHFSAFYGLQNFTWALLDLPAGDMALLVKNNQGHTPAKLALKAGYSKLAQDLENVSVVTALSRGTKASNPDPPEREGLEGTPASYDIPPAPREVGSTAPIQPRPGRRSASPLIPKDDTIYTNLLHDSSSSITSDDDVVVNDSCLRQWPPLASSLVGEAAEAGQYLDMSGRSVQFEEYQKDISLLVDAWDNRNDAKTFLSEYQHTISTLKQNFHFKPENSAADEDRQPSSPLISGGEESRGETNEDFSSDPDE